MKLFSIVFQWSFLLLTFTIVRKTMICASILTKCSKMKVSVTDRKMKLLVLTYQILHPRISSRPELLNLVHSNILQKTLHASFLNPFLPSMGRSYVRVTYFNRHLFLELNFFVLQYSPRLFHVTLYLWKTTKNGYRGAWQKSNSMETVIFVLNPLYW